MSKLYLVATPIGNLEDLSFRALRILRKVDYILCEDTRVTLKLLNHYEIKNKKLISYHQHTNEKKVNEIIKLISNHDAALVTDAGTPGISDPNILTPFRGVLPTCPSGRREGSKNSNTLQDGNLSKGSLNVTPIPGPSALTTALSVSGLPTDKFLFKGFVPHKKGRQKFLREVLESKITVVFYESPYRIIKTLESIRELLANISEGFAKPKQLVVCRELTKKFETIYRGNAEEILNQLKKDFPMGNPKGEFVLVAH